ncbi:MAG TPA: ATP-dependent helicase [Ktedonobacterales bacterium]|jgi:superfamily I DNA/RNA helicase
MQDLFQARAAARQLLARYEAAHPKQSSSLESTPIDALIEWLGLAVEQFNPLDYPIGTLGWLEPGEDLIWLAMHLEGPVRRFTLAHELGHWVLHRQPEISPSGALNMSSILAESGLAACTDEDVEAYVVASALEDEMLAPGQSYSPRARRERAADVFAAELLAPLARVRALFLGMPERPGLAPDDLAAYFGITRKALLGRLAELLEERPQKPTEEASTIAQEGAATLAKAPAATSPAAKAYDPYQQAAIEAPTPALVVAGPGSGKTSTLVGRVRYLIDVQGVPPHRILALTFSNKAAREMRERIAGAVSEQSSQPTVSTFHSFCVELLRSYAAQVGLRPDFALLDTPDGYFLLRRLASRLSLQHYAHLSHPELHFASLLGAVSRAKDELAAPEDYLRLAEAARASAESDEERLKAEKACEVALVYQTYQEALAVQGDADFGDLILLTVRFLRGQPAVLAEVQERYRQILVDEFQDINRASGVLLKLLAGERANIWVVGDQDQAIYRFRGASPANIGQFHRDYPGARVFPLSRNYRSMPDIVAAAGAFREAVLHPESQGAGQAAEHIPDGPQGQPGQVEQAAQAVISTRQEAVRSASADLLLTLATAPDEYTEVAGLANEIAQRYRAGTPYRDQVILCRTREHARVIAEGLEHAGIPVGMGGGLLEQSEVKDVLAIISLLADPSGMGLLRAGHQPEHAIPSDDLLAFFAAAQRLELPAGMLLWQPENFPPLSPQGFDGLMRLTAILTDLRAAPDLWTLLARYLFIHTSRVQNLLIATDRASRLRLEHMRGLLDLARRFDAQERKLLEKHGTLEEAQAQLDEGRQWERFLDYLRVLMELRADGNARREGEERESEAEDVVRVMTVHASKGLEFPVVYLPQLAQNRFPFARRGETAPPPPGLCEDESARNREDARAAHLLDEACLFYVALTRARDELILSRAEKYKGRRYSPSDFLRYIEVATGSRLRSVRWEGAELALLGATQRDDAVQSEPIPLTLAPPATLSVGALETYLRCPRQYKYRYLYAFQPNERGYRQFYAVVQSTLRALHEHFSVGLLASATRSATDAPTRDSQPEPALSLEAAREIFAEQWLLQGPEDHPFAETYLEHGQRLVEAVWSNLAGVSSEQAGEEQAREHQTTEAQHSGALKLEAGSRLAQKLQARIAEQTIQVTIDRIDDETVPASGESSADRAGQRPVRLVRHRMGGKDDEAPQVAARHLIYALAQEQRTPDRPVEVYEQNLSTGALIPIPLNSRGAQNRRAEIEAALAGLHARRYPPKPDRSACPRCPFVLICPAE